MTNITACMNAMYHRIEDINRITYIIDNHILRGAVMNPLVLSTIITEPLYAIETTERDCNVKLGKAKKYAEEMITELSKMKDIVKKPTKETEKIRVLAELWKNELKNVKGE